MKHIFPLKISKIFMIHARLLSLTKDTVWKWMDQNFNGNYVSCSPYPTTKIRSAFYSFDYSILSSCSLVLEISIQRENVTQKVRLQGPSYAGVYIQGRRNRVGCRGCICTPIIWQKYIKHFPSKDILFLFVPPIFQPFRRHWH